MGTFLGTDDPNARTIVDELMSAFWAKSWIRPKGLCPVVRKGRPSKELQQARAILAKLKQAGIDLDSEKREVIYSEAKALGYRGSLRTLDRARGRK
jgi:hypothetical protein